MLHASVLIFECFVFETTVHQSVPTFLTHSGRWMSMCTLYVLYHLPKSDSILVQKCRTFWSSCQRHWEKLNLSKARKSHLRKVEIPSPILSSPPTTASTETVSGENSAGCPTEPSRKQPEPGPPATCPAPLAERQKSNAVTHSGHSTHPTGYLQDFVQT